MDPNHASSEGVAALRIRTLSKTFTGQQALRSVGLEVQPGQIHGLIGQNGSGKSTLVKVLAGYHEPDVGAEIWVRGVPLTTSSPSASRAAGMRFVHQDLGLVPSLSVSDNFALGGGRRRALAPALREEERGRVHTALGRLGYEIDPRVTVSKLTQSERAILAVARALDGLETEACLLVVDEATAAMPWSEASRLLASIKTLASHGIGVLYVSHHLDEILAAADWVTVLRDGSAVASMPTTGLSHGSLAEAMLGRQLMTKFDEDTSRGRTEADPVLRVDHLRGDAVKDLSFTVRRGEAVGVAGLTGSGREEVAGLLTGRLARAGDVVVGGCSLPPGSPGASARAGMAYVPADRVGQALLPTGTVRENITLGWLSQFWRRGRLNRRAEQGDVHRWSSRMHLQPRDPELPIMSLSGGNQQKAVLARCLRRGPEVLVLDEPTQGVDVGSKVEIHRTIHDVISSGAAVVVCSTDSDELARLCTKVIFLHRGGVIGTLSGVDVTSENIEHQQLQPSKRIESTASSTTGRNA